MADIARDGTQIVLKLSVGERIMAVHRDVRVPLSAVKSVDIVDGPIRRIQGLKPRNFKVFGGYWPGWFAYGSRHGEPLLKTIRQLIESVNDTLNGQLDLEAHGGRTFEGVAIRIAQRILADTGLSRTWVRENSACRMERS